MKLQINHYGHVEAGKLKLAIPDLYRQQLAELEGQEVVMVIKKKHKKPTNSQYGYYRGAILGTCFKTEHFNGLDKKDDIHDLYFAPKFLSYKQVVLMGGRKKGVIRVRSLADLTDEEMSEFISRCL